MRLHTLGAAMAILFGGSSFADVPQQAVVIYDAGQTYDMSLWVSDEQLEDLRPKQTPEQMQAAVKMAYDSFSPTNAQVPSLFPLTPKVIRPVTLPGTQMKKDLPTLPQPIFVIGTDPYSLAWFKTNRAVLEQYGAMGVLTTAKNQTEWEFMQQLVAPLQLFPMNADALADQLGVPGYPILITKGGFFQ